MFYASEDGFSWYLWAYVFNTSESNSFLGISSIQLTRIFALIITPTLMVLLGAFLIKDAKLELN